MGILAVVGVAIGVSCSGAKPTSQAQTEPAPVAKPTSAVLTESAPNFSIQTSSGSVFTLSEHRREPVVLFFMAPGCPACARMLPGLAKAKKSFSGQWLQVFGLNLFPEAYSLEDVVKYANSLGADNPIWAQDEKTAIARSYRLQTLGATVVINRDGAVTGRFLSAVSYDTLENLVQQAATQ